MLETRLGKAIWQNRLTVKSSKQNRHPVDLDDGLKMAIDPRMAMVGRLRMVMACVVVGINGRRNVVIGSVRGQGRDQLRYDQDAHERQNKTAAPDCYSQVSAHQSIPFSRCNSRM